MIVKKNFSLFKVWQYIKSPMYLVLVWSFAVWVFFYFFGWDFLTLNFAPVGILGSALAIFVAFRNNSSYARWWEARTIWGGIVNSSRVFARLVITFTDSHSHQPNYEKQRSEDFKKTLVNLSIAWTHSLRLHLRNQQEWELLKTYMEEADFRQLLSFQNKPNFLQLLIGKKIYTAMANGTLGGFDSFQMEGQLLALANYQGACERIKNTPLPRQYDFFTRMFVLVFSALLPFGILGFFTSAPNQSWMVIPLSVIVSGVFVIMEKTGAANENPFENQITDVPMSALCNTVERDLLEMLEEKNLPEKLEPENGYLF